MKIFEDNENVFIDDKIEKLEIENRIDTSFKEAFLEQKRSQGGLKDNERSNSFKGLQ